VPAGAGGSEDETSNGSQATDAGSSASENRESKAKATKRENGCGTTASSDCTPRVGPDGQIRVDAMYYRLVNVRTAESLGDQQYGLGETADGVYVIAKIRVRSDKDESATLTSSTFQLQVGRNVYDTDSAGTIAAAGANEEPFFLKDIGPDVTTTGTVVFDVPASALKRKPELRFNELGFGDGHGFIRLPALS
jgi:hypothetical protein